MKEIKFILFNMLTAIYVSSWWAAARWGHEWNKDTGNLSGALWIIPACFTFVLVILAAGYIQDNWNDK